MQGAPAVESLISIRIRAGEFEKLPIFHEVSDFLYATTNTCFVPFLIFPVLNNEPPYEFSNNCGPFKLPSVRRCIVVLIYDKEKIRSYNWYPLQSKIK
ncbi:hypothetical protein DYBT9623_05179 [Dyadobacter sp. CECT 9623]|uniref:Uncharacterized protein n=1 Tax=Dyadobacter linearis TaxID=2823330 RepID=A0ABN7REC7_9BACT|nr:hypothetical protein DYBT9623_05179 [Dyadobacter sp. CECT 9623]